MENSRNLLIAVALSAVLLFGWEMGVRYFYPQTGAEQQSEAAQKNNPADGDAAARGESTPVSDAAADPNAHKRDGGLTNPADIAAERRDLRVALAEPGRIKIDAPELAGSINPVGARIDDVVLKTHRETVERDSGPVRMFSPAGTPAQHFAQFGWVGEGVKVPDAETLWQSSGGPLTQKTPVTLSWDNGEGQLFTIKLSVDQHYMITAEQTIANTGQGSVALRPFALVNRTSATASPSTWTIHSGPIGTFDDSVQFGPDYDDLTADPTEGKTEGAASWIGFTDIYWLSALVPQSGSAVDADFRPLGNNIFRADVIYQPVTIAPGKQVTRSTKLFVGAKESAVLDGYEAGTPSSAAGGDKVEGINKFGLAIDWGWFRWFEKPIFWLLEKIYSLAGNFGVAIILLTILIRLIMFPIAQKQFASMAAMRAVQPKMKAIQERYKDDKQKQQQEIMGLYKKEGINPLAGCLPILLQIPVFFALYKVLMLAIEMRHKPFVFWIEDLSAPDPAHILNLFGLLPFEVPSFLAIGPLAVLLGVTMWLTFRLNPTAMDPMQKQIFALMPWVLMFVMAPFAAGLLVYWITNNLLTLAQQTYLYSRHPQLKAQKEKELEQTSKSKG